MTDAERIDQLEKILGGGDYTRTDTLECLVAAVKARDHAYHCCCDYSSKSLFWNRRFNIERARVKSLRQLLRKRWGSV